MADTALVKLKIDGIDVEVPAGTVVIEAAKRAGIDVPFFCYHPRLSMEQGANCRMCLVEVASPRKNPDGTVSLAKFPKPQTACSLPVSEGMEVVTENAAITKDRKGIVEFLLINHPLDCPICDRGGECPLQNNAIHYGAGNTRYQEEKRHFPKAYPLSEHVVFDRERCIHCARCTRFTQDISGDAQLDFLFRGANMEVGTHGQTEFKSKFSGNVIELCPVGALLSRNYRFKARPWDLITQKSLCTECSNGCNIKIDYRVGKLQRVNARVNEQVNEEWTCDRGKFGMGYVSADDRLKTPMHRKDGKLVPVSWEEAMSILTGNLKAAGASVGAIAGSKLPNEDLYALQTLFRNVLGSNNLDHRMGPNFPVTNGAFTKRHGYHSTNTSIADLESMKTILVFGSNLVDEQPIIFLRARKAWRFHGTSIVEALPSTSVEDEFPNHVKEFASVSLRYKPGTEIALISGFLSCILDEKLIDEKSSAALETLSSARAIVNEWPVKRAAETAGVTEDAIRRAARLIATDKLAIIVGEFVTDHPEADQLLGALGSLAAITGNLDQVNIPVTGANFQGAMDMGVLPDSGPGYANVASTGLNTKQMLEAASKGELLALWAVQADILSDYQDRAAAEAALKTCPFVVVNALSLNATTEHAHLVLPVQSIAERDGTMTNVERRVQRFYRCFELAPGMQSDWGIFIETANVFGHPLPWFSWRDILREIVDTVPGYAGLTASALEGEGYRWSYGSETAPTPELEIEPEMVAAE
jgi:NADH-quinone oxidoreductase subunit G